MLNNEIILKLLDILPQWYIVGGLTIYIFHMICKNQLKTISKIILKNKSRREKEMFLIKESIKEINLKINNIQDLLEKNINNN